MLRVWSALRFATFLGLLLFAYSIYRQTDLQADKLQVQLLLFAPAHMHVHSHANIYLLRFQGNIPHLCGYHLPLPAAAAPPSSRAPVPTCQLCNFFCPRRKAVLLYRRKILLLSPLELLFFLRVDITHRQPCSQSKQHTGFLYADNLAMPLHLRSHLL